MGIPWRAGAIGNAKWEGILLYDIIKYNLNKNIKYIHFEGYDGVKISIEVDKVINDNVILAYKMNDEILPEDHGYPLRVIVPGYIGINNIKWLKNIVLSDKEIESPWEKGINYKIIKNYNKNLDLSKYPTIKNIKIQTCITNVNKLNNEIEGYAISSNIKNVEIEFKHKAIKPIRLGNLVGNKFIIKISDIKGKKEDIEKLADELKEGFPNYFGIQRFGAVRPITHLVGKKIVMGKFLIGHKNRRRY